MPARSVTREEGVMRTEFFADESAQWAMWLVACYILSPIKNIRRRREKAKHAR